MQGVWSLAVIMLFGSTSSHAYIVSFALAVPGGGMAVLGGHTEAGPVEYVTYSEVGAQAWRMWASCYYEVGQTYTASLTESNNLTTPVVVLLPTEYFAYCGYVGTLHCTDTKATALHIQSGQWISLDLDSASFREPEAY